MKKVEFNNVYLEVPESDVLEDESREVEPTKIENYEKNETRSLNDDLEKQLSATKTIEMSADELRARLEETQALHL